jgi:hypothetical protein
VVLCAYCSCEKWKAREGGKPLGGGRGMVLSISMWHCYMLYTVMGLIINQCLTGEVIGHRCTSGVTGNVTGYS